MSNSTDLHELVPWQRGPTERGGFSIIFTCLGVIVTSTWTALHLNVPGLLRYHNILRHQNVFSPRRFPSLDFTTVRKMKWTLIMLVFPELVFAHAILELRMALEDYVRMDEAHVAIHMKGWCIEVGNWVFVLLDLLEGKLPNVNMQYSQAWPWIKIKSGRKCQTDEWDVFETGAGAKQIELVEHHSSAAAEIPDQQDRTAVTQMDVLKPKATSRSHDDEILTTNDHGPQGTADTSNNAPLPTNILTHDRFEHWPDYYNKRFTSGHPPICRELNKPMWTLAHVYLANMGGITWNGRPATSDYLIRELSETTPTHNQGLMTIMRPSKLSYAQIHDKSKADVLIKMLWIWQIVRLWAETLTRAALQLPVTQLEIITISFSVVSIFIYVVYWPKPKDVEEPIDFQDEKLLAIGGLMDLESLSATYLVWSPSHNSHKRTKRSRVPNDVCRVHHEGLFLAALTVSTTLFGLVHCLAWNFNFATTVERWLWRAFALSSVLLPLVTTLFAHFVFKQIQRQDGIMATTTHEIFALCDKIEAMTNGYVVPSTHMFVRTFNAQALAAGVKSSLASFRGRDMTAESDELDRVVKRFKDAMDRRRDLMVNRTYYLILPIVVYSLTRVAIIAIAFTSFRKAPRGIYRDTWAAFWPTFQ